MIALKVVNHDYTYELSDIIKMFFGKEDIKLTDSEALAENQSFFLVSSIISEPGVQVCKSEIVYEDGRRYESSHPLEAGWTEDEKKIKRAVKMSMYKLLSKALEKEFPWGVLTGIRPVKLVHEMLDRGEDRSSIIAAMKTNYLVSEDRAKLAADIAETERKYIYPANSRTVSVYAGIPFCPTRCHYCSFTSNSIKAAGKYVDGYLASMKKEIEAIGSFLSENGIVTESIYLGGGTPTSINEEQLEDLLKHLNQTFGGHLREFTCEAGRPDTINEKKLEILKRNGVGRLSINPQTMNDDTLVRIGRAHDSASVVRSFALAREMGFDNINMDLILGLPGEGTAELEKTLEAIGELQPDSVTVHTMAIKRASVYNEIYGSIKLADDEEIIRMMELAKAAMKEMDLQPYYLYRQKHMLQNMENIGFAKRGKECIYNMQIIEEWQTNVAFGADAVTKAVFGSQNRIERQHNIKDIRLYIENIDRMIERKRALLEQVL